MLRQILLLLTLVSISTGCSKKLRHLNQSQLHMVSIGNMIRPPIGSMDINRKAQLTNETEPFRIYVHYDEANDDPVNKENKAEVKNELIPEVVQFFKSAFQIRKLSKGNMTFGRTCKDSTLDIDFGLDFCSEGNCKAKEQCDEVDIPDDHLKACNVCNKTGDNCKTTISQGRGFDGHFVLYTTFRTTEECDKDAVAFALSCRIGDNSLLNRPLAGRMNICPYFINEYYTLETKNMLKRTIMHELIHAMGFNVDLYPFFHDEDGVPRTKRAPNGYPPTTVTYDGYQIYKQENVVAVYKVPWWTPSYGYLKKTRAFLITPKVVKEVRAHFNCHHPDIKGAELEDQETDGMQVEKTTSAGSHLERRIFMDQLMNPTTGGEMLFSRVVMALLEDTGWYKANYSYAELTSYGKDAGCDFLHKSCGEYIRDQRMKNESIAPYCFDTLLKPKFDSHNMQKISCQASHDAVLQSCAPYIYGRELEPISQNFDPSTVGPEYKRVGGNSYANFCPVVEKFDFDPPEVCSFYKPVPNGLLIQDKTSVCLDVLTNTAENCSMSESRPMTKSACAKTICKDNRLYIEAPIGTMYPCYYEGQKIKLTRYDPEKAQLLHYTVVCPSCRVACIDETCEKQSKRVEATIGDPDDLYKLNCLVTPSATTVAPTELSSIDSLPMENPAMAMNTLISILTCLILYLRI